MNDSEMLRKMYEMMRDPRLDVKLGDVIDRYLADAKGELGQATHKNACDVLGDLKKALGAKSVGELTPLDLREWIRAHPGWKSAATTHTINSRAQRCMNWAVTMKLIRENPFKGVSYPAGEPRNEMPDDVYRALLRNSDARFRRLLIFFRFTGARPCEACRLEWPMIDWDASIYKLWNHKTRKKTKKPRIICLHPVVVKLLRWIQAHPEKPTFLNAAIAAIRAMFADGPIRATEFHRRAREIGLPRKNIYRLAFEAGARSWRAGGTGETGYEVWGLAEQEPEFGLITRPGRPGFYASVWINGRHVQRKLSNNLDEARILLEQIKAARLARCNRYQRTRKPLQPDLSHVFLDAFGRPWTKGSISNRMQRAKERAGLPATFVLYGLRHKFGTDAVRRGVSIVVLANLMGHKDISTTCKNYCHVENDFPTLHDGLSKLFSKGGPA